MARPLRIQYPGAVYHITCRGNDRKEIFKNDADRKKFLKLLLQSLNIYTVNLYSYVFMTNHFHLLLETPLGNLAEFMRHFNISYTSYYNKRHKRVGHLYQGRYKSILIDKDAYLSVLSRYIHLNPVRIKEMDKAPHEEKIRYLAQYPWSSLPGFINESKREGHIDYGMLLAEYGGETEKGRKAYNARLSTDLMDGIEIKDSILGQSILGGEAYIEWVKENFLKSKNDLERPSIKQIQGYRAINKIFEAIKDETGKGLEEIKNEKGVLRQICMELLYRFSGLKGFEIGRLMGVGYTSVSQERKRLRERMLGDRKIKELMNRIEEKCQQ